MGFVSIAKGALSELIREPLLFLPQLISTTLFIPPYLMLFQATAQLASNPYLASSLLPEETTALAIILVLTPPWIFLNSLYPELIRQRERTGRLQFKEAAKHVWKRYLKILAFYLLTLILTFAIGLPFILMMAFGLIFLLPLFALGLLLLVAAIFGLGILFYFTPSSIVIGNSGIIGTFKESAALSRQNFSFVFWLTLLSFAVLLLGFYAGGALQTLGVIGFIAGRYVGAILTVYLWVINPAAYLHLVNKRA